jgi:quercetin dioxygenase-like cupin family protein
MHESSGSRGRPRGETAGSSQRPARRLEGAALGFDLAREVASLREEEAWRRGDRNAKTLVEQPGLRVVLSALHAGTHVREHRTDGWVTIQTLEGHIRVAAQGETLDLPEGRILALESGVPHDVEAIEQSAFLLTIARPTGG